MIVSELRNFCVQRLVSFEAELIPLLITFYRSSEDLTVLLLQPQKLVESECLQANLVEMLFSED